MSWFAGLSWAGCRGRSYGRMPRIDVTVVAGYAAALLRAIARLPCRHHWH